MQYILILLIIIFHFAVAGTAAAQHNASQPRLADILAHVHRSNPELLAAREELSGTRELYPQARAGWLPSINAEASLYNSDIRNSNFSGADGTTTKDMTITLDQPVFRGGRTTAEIARAEDLIRAGEFILYQAEQDMFFDVIASALNLVRDQEILYWRTKNEDIVGREYQAAAERAALGELSQTDVYQAQTRLSRANADRIRAETQLKITKARFEEKATMPAPQTLSIPHINLQIPQSAPAMIQLAEDKNAELKIAKWQHSVAENNIDAIFRELLPHVSAFASYNMQYDPQPGLVDDSHNRTVGLRARLALYHGGTIRSRTREARFDANRREFEIEALRLRIKQNVNSAWHGYEGARAEVSKRHEEVAASTAALQGVIEEARIGQRTILHVLDADQEFIEAQIALTAARQNEHLAYFALARAIGVLDTAILMNPNSYSAAAGLTTMDASREKQAVPAGAIDGS